jgi:hypothetical protein
LASVKLWRDARGVNVKPPTVVALKNDSAIALEVPNVAVPVGTVPRPNCCPGWQAKWRPGTRRARSCQM